jgi:hypothetical protein
MSLCLVIILGWQLVAGIQQYRGALQMVDQQAALAKQAAQTESKLQSMMADLLLLAKTDTEAQAIVTKYRIKMNAEKPDTVVGPRVSALPAGGAASPTPPAGGAASPTPPAGGAASPTPPARAPDAAK